MAIAIQMDFPGGTLDQYDRVMDKMGFRPGGAPPPQGVLFHWAAGTDEGLRVVDVWKTRAEFDDFAKAQIAPITAEMGMQPPQMRFFELHNHLPAG